MSDLKIAVLAMATACGALLARPLLWLCIGAATAWLLTRGHWLFILTCAATASTLSAHAWVALDSPVSAEVSGKATLLSDPEFVRGALRVEARVDGRLMQLWVRGESMRELRERLAGQHVLVEGTTSPLTGLAAASQRRKHIAANLNVTSIRYLDAGGAMARATNAIRSNIDSGASSMSRENKALLTGLVYGDDRQQSDEVTQQFRGSGLSHLLAVSGQNVAFVLLIFAPLLTRVSLLNRLIAGFVVLFAFGALTRWEPSVLRAEAMAGAVLIGSYLGRPVSLVRALGLGTTAALLVDPFLIGSIGFLLSVGACCGMALLGNFFTDQCRGPLWFKRSVGFSLAAQMGVAPVQLSVFGGIPVVSLLANVLAEPVAGVAMVWGCVAGTVAGVIGEPLASYIHIPTTLFVGWIALVARATASLALGNWTPTLVWLVVGVWLFAHWWREYGRSRDDDSATRLSGEGRRSGIVESRSQ